jgi:hypothetical protein
VRLAKSGPLPEGDYASELNQTLCDLVSIAAVTFERYGTR